MIAVDTNVLVYAHNESSAKHEAARRRLTELADSPARWAIPVFCVGEFLRVMTHPRLFDPPVPADRACAMLERLLESPSLAVLVPGDRYFALLAAAVREANAVGNLAVDAQIVALCCEHGVRELLTEDRDFARFPGFATARV